MYWENVPEAIKELVDLIDDERATNNFRLHEIKVRPDPHNPETLVVIALDKEGKIYKYAIFVTPHGNIADGY